MKENFLPQADTRMPALREVKSKRDIESLSLSLVSQEMEEGHINPVEELVMATKLSAFFAARIDALRPHALNEMREMNETGSLGAKVQKTKAAGRWAYSDEYLDLLKAEVKTVEGKAQQKEEKDRVHITLAGEEVFISRGAKTDGGETVKVLL